MISKMQWNKHIDSLKTESKIKDKKEIERTLRKLLLNSVEKNLPKKRFGIMFSGGLDSSLIALLCKKLNAEFICYTVGFYDGNGNYPNDVVHAQKIAKKLKLNLKIKVYNLNEAEEIIRRAVEIVGLGRNNIYNIVNIGVGSVVYAASSIAKEDKIDTFFTGLGAEEIFAGYQKHLIAKDIDKECWLGLKEMYTRDFLRDDKLRKALRIKFITPFLDACLIKYAMQIPSEYKINNEQKKIILREVAHKMGLYKKIAFRKKQAAQYGSRFDKAISKLAKRNGFDKKKLWLKSLK